MRIAASAIIAALGLSLLAGCAEDGSYGMGTKQTVGTVGGAAAGAAAGYFIGGRSGWGALIGGVAGGLLGNVIGQQLDEADRREAAAAAERAMNAPVGTTQTWANPNTGNSGAVTTTAQRSQAGRVCKDFQTSVRTGSGQSETGTGTACQNPDGSWSII